ncbi:MAG: NYN domain-containing protein [Candidatus Methylomirabilales bacterium]
MRWLVDGYNVIRRAPELAACEQESLQAGREALCRLLATAVHVSGDRFTVVFDGARGGGSTIGSTGVRVIFSSARETADSVLARLATSGSAVVSNDHEVRRAAARAGAIAITTDEFLARVRRPAGPDIPDKDEDNTPAGPKKGNPRRLSKKARAAARALRRLGRTSKRFR